MSTPSTSDEGVRCGVQTVVEIKHGVVLEDQKWYVAGPRKTDILAMSSQYATIRPLVPKIGDFPNRRQTYNWLEIERSLRLSLAP